MEKLKGKLNLKIIIPIIVAIVAIIVVIVLITGNKEKKCIGTWKIANGDNDYYQTIILYKGGTGEMIGVNNYGEERKNTITWEFKDNTINIDNGILGVYGYTIKKDKITSVDGKHTYNKVK